MPPSVAGMTTNVVPLGAIFWGWFDHEPISAAQCGAMLGILAMVSLVQFRAAQRHAPQSSTTAADPKDDERRKDGVDSESGD